jgi:hypothetical protein
VNRRHKPLTSERAERLEDILVRCRDIYLEHVEVEIHQASPSPLSIDGRIFGEHAAATYSIAGLSITIDFGMLGSLMLQVADLLFADEFAAFVTFDQGNMQDVVDIEIAASLKKIDGTAAATLADYFTEIVFHGVSAAAESFAEQIRTQIGRPLTKQERKPLRAIARDAAAALLATRIPSVGRGGETRTPEMAPDQLIAFHEAIQRVSLFWSYTKQRAMIDESAWDDAVKMPEYRRFKAAEKRHAEAVMTLLRRGRKVNGAPASPAVLAREHARLIVRLPQSSDSKLRKLAAKGKGLAAPLSRKGT